MKKGYKIQFKNSNISRQRPVLGFSNNSQGKIHYKEKVQIKVNVDDDQKILAQKKKRLESINKRTNIVQNKSIKQLFMEGQFDYECVVQEQMNEEFRIEGSRMEGSKMDGSRMERSRREGSRREASRREMSRRDMSRREGTYSKRKGDDLNEYSIRKGEGSKFSMLNFNSHQHSQYRNDSNKRQDSKYAPMAQSSKFSIEKVNENSHVQVRSNLHASQFEDYYQAGSGSQIGSTKKKSFNPKMIDSQLEGSQIQIAMNKNSFISQLNVAIEKSSTPIQRKSLMVQKSIIQESPNEEDSSFLRSGSRHKSSNNQTGPDKGLFFQMGTKRKSHMFAVADMTNSQNMQKSVHDKDMNNSIREDSFLRKGTKKGSIVGDSIQELINSQAQASVFQRRQSRGAKSQRKMDTFIINEQQEEEDYLDVQDEIQSKNSKEMIKELMQHNDDNFSDSQPVSMFDDKSSKSSLLKERTIDKQLNNLPLNLKNRVIVPVDLQTRSKMKLFHEINQSQQQQDVLKQQTNFDQQKKLLIVSPYSSAENSMIDVLDNQIEDENPIVQIMINSSQWRNASKDQLSDRSQIILSRPEHLMSRIQSYEKNVCFNQIIDQNEVEPYGDIELDPDELDDDNDDDDDDDDDDNINNEDSVEEYYDEYPEDEQEEQSEDEYDDDDQDEEGEDYDAQSTAKKSFGTKYENLEEDYEVLAVRDPYLDYYSLKIIQVHDMRWILSEYSKYLDNYPLLTVRKVLFFIIEVMYVISYKIVSSKYWVFFILFTTVANIVTFLFFRYDSQNEQYRIFQLSFLCMYTFEVLVKQMGNGLQKYFQDNWNFYDLLILFFYALHVFDKNWMPFDVSTFRVIRIPFFLSHLNKNLYIMLTSLQVSFSHLMETLLVVLIFSGFFALIALHLFSGVLHYICFDLESGLFVIPQLACGYTQCPISQTCLFNQENPDLPTSYDNFIYSYVQVLRTITQNEWVSPMYQTMRAFHPSTFVLYILIILVGEKFCFNLVIAVLKVQYGETTSFFETHEMEEQVHEHEIQLNMRILKDIKLYQQLKQTIAKYKNFIGVKTIGHFQPKVLVKKETVSHTPDRGNFETKKDSKEVKLLSGRQRNMVDNYKKKMQKAFENSSWMIKWLLPHHPIQKHMKQIILDQENIFLQYYDLQLYYRFRSLDFLSLNVSLKDFSEIDYQSSSQTQVLEVKEAKKKIDKEKELMAQKLPFHFPEEQYIQIKYQYKADVVRLPILYRRKDIEYNLSENSYLTHKQQELSSRTNNQQVNRINVQSIRNLGLKVEEEQEEIEQVVIDRVRKNMNRKQSIVSQQVKKLFRGSLSFIESSSSSSEDDQDLEKLSTNKFLLMGEVKEFEDIVELINQPVEEIETKPKQVDYKEKYMKLRMHDAAIGTIKDYNWSGDEVLDYTKYTKRTYSWMKALNDTDEMKKKDRFLYFHYLVKKNAQKMLNFSGTLIFIDVCICMDTIMLSLHGIADEQLIIIVDSCLNYILMFELFLKVLSQNEFFSTWNGIIQTLIILLSSAQMLVSEIIHTNVNNEYIVVALVYIGVIKALLFFRVIQYNKFARKLMYIAYKTLPQYINLTLLMFFIILTYSLLGLQIFGDHFDVHTERGQLHSFGDAAKGWVSVFDVSTMDNWYSIMILGTTHANKAATIIFCITMVFLINYLMKELLMAIILEEFAHYLVQYEYDNFHDTEEGEGSEADENLEANLEENNEGQDMPENNQSFQISSGDSDKNGEKNERQIQLLRQTNPNKVSIDYFRKVELKMKKDYFNLSTLLDRLTEQQRNKAQYESVECQFSFFIFSKQNIVRKLCYKILMTKQFENFFILNFIITLASMMMYTFVDHKNEFLLPSISQREIQSLTTLVNLVTNSLIIMEGFIKMIAFGCFNDSGSYFGDYIRGIDFIYCCNYNISTLYPVPQLLFFNMLGYQRPLRVLSIFSTFKEERKALYNSITHILSILQVLLLFWFIFAIFGVAIYRGKMAYCDDQLAFYKNEEICLHEQGKWIIFEHNFENIFQALATLFIIATLDEWGPIMQICMNGTINGPEPFANEWVTYVYFVTFVFVGSLFFLGFFAGILFIKFKENKSQIVNPDLNSNQMHFIQISEAILREITYYSDPPRSWMRIKVQSLMQQKIWHYFVVFALISNIVVLALFYLEASKEYSRTLNLIHHCLSAVFILDCFLKLLSYHIIRYMGHVWRKIEFLISLHALIDVLIDLNFQWFELYLSTNVTDRYFIPIRVFFILRDARVLLIIQEFQGIQRLLHVIQFSLGSLSKLLCLVVLVMMVYAFFGCNLFGTITKGEVLTDQQNFENFFNAMLTLFRISGRNGWRGVLADSSSDTNEYCAEEPEQCGQPILVVYLYYFSFMIIITYSLLNLFILSLVDEFESFYAIHNSVLEIYIENIDKFRTVWCKFTYEKRGAKMHIRFLAKFLLQLGEPLGSLQGDNIWDAAKTASNFEIKSDQFGYIHFKELLYETVKYSFKDRIFKGGTYEGFRQMKQHDKKMRYRLQCVRDFPYRREVLNPVIELKGNFNILQEYLYVLMALKTWKNYSGRFIENAKDFENSFEFTEQDEMDSENSSESQEVAPNQCIVEEKDSQLNVSHQSLDTSSKKDDWFEDLVLYEQKPKVRLKVSYLDRIYQQRVKDNILFAPKQIENS